MTCYDPAIDEEILKLVDNFEEITFNKMFDFLKKSDTLKSKITLNKHLNFLRDKKIIEDNSVSIGKKRPIKFTSTAQVQRKYGILRIDYNDKRRIICKEWKEKNEKESATERRLKMLLFLLVAMSYGSRIYETPSTPRIGMILVRDQDGKQIGISLNSEKSSEGFSPEDLDKKNNLSPFKDLLLWNRFTKEDTKQIIDAFEDHQIINFQHLTSKDGEERYRLKDEGLERLLIWCSNILKIVVSTMEEYWFILSKKPTTKEVQWYNFVVGNEKTTEFFLQIEENRARKKTIEELYHQYKLRLSYVTHPKYIENEIEQMKKHSKKIFTRKAMQQEIFNKAFKNDHSSFNYSIKRIHGDKEIEKLIKEGKYTWILGDLKYIINPDFLKKYGNFKEIW